MTEVTDYIDFAPYDMSVEDRRKLDVGDIFINQIKCKSCGWYIRSKNRHHYVLCKCETIAIDGGSWYSKINGPIDLVENHQVMYKNLPLEVPYD